MKAYTETSIWRNRDQFIAGHAEIIEFLTKKWEKEKDYRLRKELFSWHDNKIAAQFWYEYRDADRRMWKRQMSGNDVVVEEGERWFVDGKSVDDVEIGDKHW